MRNPFGMASFHLLHAGMKRDIARLDALNASSPEEFKAHQLQSLRAVVRHAYDHVECYRNLYREAGVGPDDLRTLEDFSRFPAITKKSLDSYALERRIGVDASEKDRLLRSTSGSTGVPFEFLLDDETVYSDMVAHNRVQLLSGWRPGETTAYLKWKFPKPRSPLMASIRRMLGLDVFEIRAFEVNNNSVGGIIDTLRRRKVRLLQGYASSIHSLARHCEREKGLGVRSVITIAESVTESQRKFIERTFGAKVFMDYSASECMRVAFECPARRGFHVDVGRYWVEIVEPDSEGVGEIVLTRLFNRAHPFIRYRIGDRAGLSWEPCPCGLSTPRLVNLSGRVMDYIMTPSGRALSNSLFIVIFEYHHQHVLRFQVRQVSDTELHALVEVSQPPTPAEIRSMEEEIERESLDTVRVKVEVVDRIPLSKTGKRPFVVPLKSEAGASQE
ncbi:phenylacetate--CoA ligase family protein [Candidatus Sumerlaeota bacterium]|nr:phenylacetate--CoA ligase family protein [Candidatus Sumerlaeota bacterium]